MKLAQKHLLLVLLQYLPLSLAQTDCTQSTALKYTTADDPCSAAATARDDTGCVAKYCENGGTSKSLNACFCLAGIGENCGSIGSRDLVVESLERRAGFTCSSSEACYINPADGGLFCLDVSTGDYVGESGDSGNVDTGAYTAASSGGGTTSATSTSTRISANSGAAATSSVRSIESAVSTRSTSILSSSGSSAGTTRATATTMTSTSASVASTTSSADGRQINAGATLGALGMVIGFLL